MRVRITDGRVARALLIGLTLWGLLMIVPDLYRVIDPLASVGLAADNDGRIYDVLGPFDRDTDSPAWTAGLRVGDRIDLEAMRCLPPSRVACSDLLSVVGGMGGVQLVRPGRVLVLTVRPATDGNQRIVSLVAMPPPLHWVERFVLLLTEIAGIAFLSAAAWLAWSRPSAMSWGFFLYAIWFNPGQDFVYFLVLQEHPPLLLAQELAASLAHGAACAGFVLFAFCVPKGEPDQPVSRSLLPGLLLLAVIVAAIQLMSFANAFGYQTEYAARATFFVDYAVDGFALWILFRRRRGQAPLNYQRMRWVIWGALIGLPAYILSGLLGSTALWQSLSGDDSVPENLFGFLLLVYGILGWFVFEAVRRPRVVNVSIPLRRITAFGLLLSVPALFAHQQIERLEKAFHLPSWAWIVLASLLIFLLGRLHDFAVELADRVFNHTFHRERAGFATLSEDILRAKNMTEIEELLSEGPIHLLNLASVAVFRAEEGVFRRRTAGSGWTAGMADRIDPGARPLAGISAGLPFHIDPADAEDLSFPPGLETPTLAVPVANRLKCFAVAFYGPHVTGADLTADEQAMLRRLAEDAALAYAHVESESMRREIELLKLSLSQTAGAR